MTTLLVTLAAEVAAVALLVAFFIAWGYAGGDDVAKGSAGPLFGLAALVGAVGALVTTVRLLQPPWALVLAGVGALALAATVTWYSRHPEDHLRRPFNIGLAVLAVATPCAFALVADARPPTAVSMAWAVVAPVATLIGLPFVASEMRVAEEPRDFLLGMTPLIGVPVLQGVAWLLR